MLVVVPVVVCVGVPVVVCVGVPVAVPVVVCVGVPVVVPVVVCVGVPVVVPVLVPVLVSVLVRMSQDLNNETTKSSILSAVRAAFLRISVAIALLCVGVGGGFMFVM